MHLLQRLGCGRRTPRPNTNLPVASSVTRWWKSNIHLSIWIIHCGTLSVGNRNRYFHHIQYSPKGCCCCCVESFQRHTKICFKSFMRKRTVYDWNNFVSSFVQTVQHRTHCIWFRIIAKFSIFTSSFAIIIIIVYGLPPERFGRTTHGFVQQPSTSVCTAYAVRCALCSSVSSLLLRSLFQRAINSHFTFDGHCSRTINE